MLLLHEILKPERKTAVVDVGAASTPVVGGSRPYATLLALGLCRVIGFEPQRETWPRGGPFETYLPHIIGDGSEGELRVCHAPWMTSLFEPAEFAMNVFRFREACAIVRRELVKTTRLDDIEDIVRIDFLKIDAQGSELAAIQGAARKLKDTVFAQLEVQFLPLYEKQPMFWEIHAAMERRGFILHTFAESQLMMIPPYRYEPRPDAAMRQIFAADAVYVRDFSRLDRLEPEAVKQMALIAHYCYGSFDLTYRCIDYLSNCGALPLGEAQRYMGTLEDADDERNRARESDDIGAGSAPVLRH